jgi:hypothetical protein
VNYDQPRRLKDGGWHYTSMNDGQVWPVGRCAEHAPHETEDDARRCYRDYEMDERLHLDGTIGHWNTCQYPEGCWTLTNRQAGISPWGPSWLLCDKHRTKEACAALYGPLAGDSVHS